MKCDKCKITSPQLETSGAKDRAVGKTLAYTSIQFTNAKGEIAARGSHTKYVANTYTRDFFRHTLIDWLIDMLHSPGSTHRISLKSCHLTGNNELSEGQEILQFKLCNVALLSRIWARQISRHHEKSSTNRLMGGSDPAIPAECR